MTIGTLVNFVAQRVIWKSCMISIATVRVSNVKAFRLNLLVVMGLWLPNVTTEYP